MDGNGKQKVSPAEARQLAAHISDIVSRASLAARAGETFGGSRDLYSAFGWKRSITFDDVYSKYRRNNIARRIVDLPVNDTWSEPPELLDGNDPETPFCFAFRDMAQRVRLWQYLERADILAGVGEYSVLLLGFKDTVGDLKLPVKGAKDLLYLSVYSQKSAQITKLDDDPQSVRFGLPLLYDIDLGRSASGLPTSGLGTRRVHASRLLHVAEGLLEDEVYGRSRLEACYNLLDDLAKTVGASAEAIWRLAYKGLFITNRDDYEMPVKGTDAADALDDQITEFIHEFRRALILEGVDVSELGGAVVDPSGFFSVVISLLSAATGIPQRKLVGSERGELASSQDERNWAAQIASRRTTFAGPVLLNPLVDRLIETGVLPEPDSGEYNFVWRPFYQPTEEEEAETALKAAGAIAKLVPQGAADILLDTDVFVRAYLPRLVDGLRLNDTGASLEDEFDEED